MIVLASVCTNTCDNHLSFVFIKCDNAHLPAFVTSGPPLELGWDWEHESSMNEVDIPIDEFEATYSPHRRSEWDLALSRGERETQLLELGFTREEIAAAIRETSKIKSQRANTVLNIKMAGIEEATEQLRTKGLELIGLRKNPDWMYNEWKNNSAEPRPLNAKRAGSIYRREGDRAAAAIVSELQSSLDYRGTSKLIRNVVRRIKRGLSSGDEYTVGSPSEDTDDGPPFGITRKSFISRTPHGSTLNSDEGMLWPFAIIEVVHPNSPAHEAKLNKGDRIIKLGNITALTSDHGRSIPALGQVAAKKDESLLMEVENIDGVRRACTIRPRNNWGGRGCFGFLFRELGE